MRFARSAVFVLRETPCAPCWPCCVECTNGGSETPHCQPTACAASCRSLRQECPDGRREVMADLPLLACRRSVRQCPISDEESVAHIRDNSARLADACTACGRATAPVPWLPRHRRSDGAAPQSGDGRHPRHPARRRGHARGRLPSPEHAQGAAYARPSRPEKLHRCLPDAACIAARPRGAERWRAARCEETRSGMVFACQGLRAADHERRGSRPQWL